MTGEGTVAGTLPGQSSIFLASTSPTMYPFNKRNAAKLLSSDDTFAFVLMTALLPAFGDRLFDTPTDILFADIEDYFDCHLSEESENRINAAITALTTDLFNTNLNVFKSIALALNEGDIGGIPDGDEEDLDAEEALMAIKEVAILNGSDEAEGEEEFSPTIQLYVAGLIDSVAEEDIPDEVDTVEEAVDYPYFVEILDDMCTEMAKQLLFLGCDQAKVAVFLADNVSRQLQ